MSVEEFAEPGNFKLRRVSVGLNAKAVPSKRFAPAMSFGSRPV